MIRTYILATITGIAFLSVLSLSPTTPAFAELKQKSFKATMSGYEEVPITLSVEGGGSFKGKLNKLGTELNYELTYSQLEGDIAAAHIHFAQKALNGGVMAWLCGGGGSGGSPPCDGTTSGTVKGTLTAANIESLPMQNFQGTFDEFLAALRSGSGYVNVHTMPFPGGEIRGQVEKSRFGFFFNR